MLQFNPLGNHFQLLVCLPVAFPVLNLVASKLIFSLRNDTKLIGFCLLVSQLTGIQFWKQSSSDIIRPMVKTKYVLDCLKLICSVVKQISWFIK